MSRRPWFHRALMAMVILLVASAALSQSLRAPGIHRYLNARLEAAFGRPVEVGRFGFSLRPGPRLEAESVTVAEDPRFGAEYFLRAERVTASLRWRALAGGKFEFGTFSFTRASLNLVRVRDGHWNVESWLPPPSSFESPGGKPIHSDQVLAAPSAPARLYRIEVDTGRLNFKFGMDRHPFALVDVNGHLEQESEGRWRIDLEARPMRAAVVLQEAGILRVRGQIGGTSARLQPAELQISWQNGSLADALRLAKGQDSGVRGRLAVELTARIEPPSTTAAPSQNLATSLATPRVMPADGASAGARWSFAVTGRFTDVHRWDLAHRAGDPALNVSIEGQWRRGEPRVEFRRCVIEAPGSNIRGRGTLGWKPNIEPEFRLTSSWVDLADLWTWYRAFRPGVADDLIIAGSAELEFALGGWPLQFKEGALTSSGARLRTASLREPIRVGHIAVRVNHGRLLLEPTAIVLPTSPAAALGPATQTRALAARRENSLRVAGSLSPPESGSQAPARAWEFHLELTGRTDRTEDLLAAAQALGHPLNHGWSAEGPAELRLNWSGNARPYAAQLLGEIELRGLTVRTNYVNQPLSFTNARFELNADQRRITLVAAEGFGARWKGTVWKKLPQSAEAPEGWKFDLTADRLDLVELDRWLGPRARSGLLERFVPFAATSRDTSERDLVLSRLRGRGRLNVDEFLLTSLALRRLRADTEIEGRTITARQAQADFYGGSVKGSLDALLLPQPAYRVEAEFDRVNLESLAQATATLKDKFTGVASGQLSMTLRGIGRQDLFKSLEGRGALTVTGAQMHGFNVKATYADGGLRLGTSEFGTVAARFTLAGEKVRIQALRLTNHADVFEAEGTVDFSRTLDLRIHAPTHAKEARLPSSAARALHITGSLDAPAIARSELPGKR